LRDAPEEQVSIRPNFNSTLFLTNLNSVPRTWGSGILHMRTQL
jgi:hypothetical protein